jgi:hypothetical protein
MSNDTRFRIKAGELIFEIQGPEDFVNAQLAKHKDHIHMIVDEQMKLIRSGKFGVPKITRGRRGRPPKDGATRRGATGRRPGRQPVIIRESELVLRPRQLSHLHKWLAGLAGDAKLGKDAAVFGIAYFLCTEVLKNDVFTAGDVIAAYRQLGKVTAAPAAASVDVVQMLRNLAAASIGKQWVERNADGTFALTAGGKQVAVAGEVVRPRGRRPGLPATPTKARTKTKAKAGHRK